MTNAQKWVAVFLGLFVVLFILGKATKEEEGFGEVDFYGEESAAPTEISGFDLVKTVGCVRCHGDDLKGTQMAPTLYDLKDHWSRKALINYLRNPSAYDGGDRFEEFKEKYSGSIMPSYGNRDVKELGKIADYILSLH